MHTSTGAAASHLSSQHPASGRSMKGGGPAIFSASSGGGSRPAVTTEGAGSGFLGGTRVALPAFNSPSQAVGTSPQIGSTSSHGNSAAAGSTVGVCNANTMGAGVMGAGNLNGRERQKGEGAEREGVGSGEVQGDEGGSGHLLGKRTLRQLAAEVRGRRWR